ncbi:MAG: hypothetical protein JWN95_4028 [Frankiales bacterium]|nr:hypothetical protein [Frankiales bacterium]
MNGQEPTPHETLTTYPESRMTPEPSASVTMPKPRRWPRVRRLLSKKITWAVTAVLICALIVLSVVLARSSSSPTTSAQSGPVSGAAAGAPGGAAGGAAPGGGGSNARSGPAAGGASGTVGSVSTSSFAMTTSAGQKVTVNEASATTYENGTSAISASGITTGEAVLVLGTTSGTTITATQVTVQPAGSEGSAASVAAGVIPFQQGAPSTAKQVGQIPANYTEGSGTIVSGAAADSATKAALAAYPGGVVDRVVQLSNGEYEVHYIGVNWPHHIFVSQDFAVVGAF